MQRTWANPEPSRLDATVVTSVPSGGPTEKNQEEGWIKLCHQGLILRELSVCSIS